MSEYIYVVHELCGGHILESFRDITDAFSYLHWEEALGNIRQLDYTVTKVRLK